MYAQAMMLGGGGAAGEKEGLELAEQLCVQGELRSCILAASGHFDGRGAKRDQVRGTMFILAACEGGFPPACEMKKRIPGEIVRKAERKIKKNTDDALAKIKDAQAKGGLPPGLGGMLPGAGLPTPSPAPSAAEPKDDDDDDE